MFVEKDGLKLPKAITKTDQEIHCINTITKYLLPIYTKSCHFKSNQGLTVIIEFSLSLLDLCTQAVIIDHGIMVMKNSVHILKIHTFRHETSGLFLDRPHLMLI